MYRRSLIKSIYTSSSLTPYFLILRFEIFICKHHIFCHLYHSFSLLGLLMTQGGVHFGLFQMSLPLLTLPFIPCCPLKSMTSFSLIVIVTYKTNQIPLVLIAC